MSKANLSLKAYFRLQAIMPTIELETRIKADIETCFDLSRSIDFHMLTTASTNEKAIAGRTSGLIELGETVTWQARHFGVKQKLTSKITAFKRPFHFRDEQVRGAFKFIIHDHYFETQGEHVLMKDTFRFQSPFGFAGKLFDKLILTNYLKTFIIARNNLVKEFAESGKWKLVLNSSEAI
jgi:ligand-binding SRPBCC domain-containing protein